MMSIVFGLAVAAIVYHHLIFPVLLTALARRRAVETRSPAVTPPERLPSIVVVMPAYNEAPFISAKIAGLLALDYPSDRYRLLVACDGCTDGTPDLATTALERRTGTVAYDLVIHPTNRGKVAVLNEALESCTEDIVVLTDVSADLPRDALLRLAEHFQDKTVGAAGGSYALATAGSQGEAAYWRFQSRLKLHEALVGAPMGLHGAFYAIRRDGWTALPAETINDDFIIPMRIVEKGRRAVYDPGIVAVERETTRPNQEWRRRRRIGAGNLQQVLACWRLADPRRPGVAFVFLSGKGLRSLMPLLFAAALATNVALATTGSLAWTAVLGVQAAFYGAAILGIATGSARRWLAWPAYVVQAYAAGGVSMIDGLGRAGLALLARLGFVSGEVSHIHPLSQAGKRLLDIVIAFLVLVVCAVLFVPIALAIRLESKGPILYRQWRVGRSWRDRTDLFYLIKFRSMRVDAEARSGAVWATARDPRITRVGLFLRKTRLDELPQCLNVLRGDMSIVGPRPERPMFFPRLEGAIPFYAERIVALRPGITGLAQVNNKYDETLDDVRTKVLFDHAYALQIASPLNWFRTDLGIMLRTFTVMVAGKGQ